MPKDAVVERLEKKRARRLEGMDWRESLRILRSKGRRYSRGLLDVPNTDAEPSAVPEEERPQF